MTSVSSLSFPSWRNVLLSATVLRISLILYSEWHDARSLVKYTDVDYRVFSDAAAFLLHSGPGDANQAQGPLTRLFGYQLDIGECVETNQQTNMSDTTLITVLIHEKHTDIPHCLRSYSLQMYGYILPLGNIYFLHAIS
jgi:hypothetical protein